MPNPFLSADRVPPPPTRLPPQGAAQPYYPGDALPSTPGRGPATQPLGALRPSPDVTPIPPDGSLAKDEAGIRIPNDEGEIRFADRNLQSAQPIASQAPSSPDAATQRVATAARQPQPVTSQVTLTPVSDEHSVASGLFRQPVDRPQPPALLGGHSAPRIRLPGAEAREHVEVVAPDAVNTMSYQVPAGTTNRTHTTGAPPPGYVPPSLGAPGFDAPQPASDGFRPRGSAREAFGSRPATPTVPTLHVTPG